MGKPIKARVIAAFTDRETMRDVYNVGDVFEGTKERVNELIGGGYVEPIGGEKPETGAKE